MTRAGDFHTLDLLARDRRRAAIPDAIGPNSAQQRSTLSQPYWAHADNWPDASPMFVDLAIAAIAGQHWVLDNAIATGFISTAIPPAGQLLSPIAGLFLVEQGRIPVENLAAAQTNPGWDIRSRGIPLPVIASIVPLASGWAYAIYYNGMIGRTVPEGWTLRGVISCNPGTPSPGPGAGSNMDLIGVFGREMNYGI